MLVAWRSDPYREIDAEGDGPPVRDRLLRIMPVNSR
jgi:hypothetical protein